MAKANLADRLAEIDALRRALAEADAFLTQQGEGRATALLALKAIYDFLKSVGLKSKALNQLSMALQDVDRGHAPLMFAPSISHRPHDSAKLLIIKAVSAAAMQLHMDAGSTRARASELVSQTLNHAGFRLPGRDSKPASAATVRGWRDKFSNSSDGEGADAYQIALQEANSKAATTAQRARLVTGSLEHLVKKSK